MKVNHGQLELLKLDGVPVTKVSVPNEAGQERAAPNSSPQRVYAITDVKYYSLGRSLLRGFRTNGSLRPLHRIPHPFTGQMATSTVEIWHPVHGEFETRAPIVRQLVREVRGEPHLFAVYGCTPLVRFPLATLKDGAHVRGETIGELGYAR